MELPLLLPIQEQREMNYNLFFDASGLYGRPALVSMPGLQLLTWSGTRVGETRGIFQDPASGALYIVVAGTLYRCTIANEIITTVDSENMTGGTSMGSTGQVWMEKNEAGDLVITNGTSVKTYNGTTMTDITATPPAAGPMCYMDKLFIMADKDGHTMTPSDVDADDWDDFDGATPSGSIDTILNVVAHKRHVHVFGGKSKEVFYNSGDATTPLVRVQGSMVEVGSSGSRSHAIVGDSIYWLTNNGRVARTAGVGGYEIVSTQLLEIAINSLSTSDFAGAIGYAIQYMGHDWYCLTFPSAYAMTYVFDVQTYELGLFPWSIWYYGGSATRFRGNCTCPVSSGYQNYTLIGDYAMGNIYKLSAAVYQDVNYYDKTTYWYPPAVRADRRMLTHGVFRLVAGQGNTPVWVLGWKDESKGYEYPNPSSRTGVLNDTDQRFEWFGLGSSPERKYRVSSATQALRIIYGASVQITGE